MRSSLFRVVTQLGLVVSYRCFRTTYRSRIVKRSKKNSSWTAKKNSSWTAIPLTMGPIGCPETSVNKYQSTLHHNPEVRRSYLYHCGSLKSRNVTCVVGNYFTFLKILKLDFTLFIVNCHKYCTEYHCKVYCAASIHSSG